MAGKGVEEVRVAVSLYRICPLGAHIDHQVLLRSGRFKGEVRFSVDEIQHPRYTVKENDKINGSVSSKLEEERNWGNYARGALYAIQGIGNHLTQMLKIRTGVVDLHLQVLCRCERLARMVCMTSHLLFYMHENRALIRTPFGPLHRALESKPLCA